MKLTESDAKGLEKKAYYKPRKGARGFYRYDMDRYKDYVIEQREAGATYTDIGRAIGYPDHIVRRYYLRWKNED